MLQQDSKTQTHAIYAAHIECVGKNLPNTRQLLESLGVPVKLYHKTKRAAVRIKNRYTQREQRHLFVLTKRTSSAICFSIQLTCKGQQGTCGTASPHASKPIQLMDLAKPIGKRRPSDFWSQMLQFQSRSPIRVSCVPFGTSKSGDFHVDHQ